MKSNNKNHLQSNILNKTLKTKLNLFKITQTHNFKKQKQTKIKNLLKRENTIMKSLKIKNKIA